MTTHHSHSWVELHPFVEVETFDILRLNCNWLLFYIPQPLAQSIRLSTVLYPNSAFYISQLQRYCTALLISVQSSPARPAFILMILDNRLIHSIIHMHLSNMYHLSQQLQKLSNRFILHLLLTNSMTHIFHTHHIQPGHSSRILCRPGHIAENIAKFYRFDTNIIVKLHYGSIALISAYRYFINDKFVKILPRR